MHIHIIAFILSSPAQDHLTKGDVMSHLSKQRLDSMLNQYEQARKHVTRNSNAPIDEYILLYIFILFQKYGKVQLNISEVSREVDLSVATLEKMRREKIGISYNKNKNSGRNGAVRYPISAIAVYMEASKVEVW